MYNLIQKIRSKMNKSYCIINNEMHLYQNNKQNCLARQNSYKNYMYSVKRETLNKSYVDELFLSSFIQ